MSACTGSRPERTSSSKTSSRLAESLPSGEITLRGAALDHAAREVEPALPRRRIQRARWRSNEQLANRRLAGTGERAEYGRVDRHDAPAEHRHAEADQRLLDELDGAVEGRAWGRQKEHAERDALAGSDTQQFVWDLREDAGAVARVVVRGGAAVRESRDGRERHAEDVGAALPARARDESDPAGVALTPGVQQTKSPLCEGSGLGGSDCGSCHAIAPRRSLGRPIFRMAFRCGRQVVMCISMRWTS